MTNDQIRFMHMARPFQPFDLYLADGRKVHVPHPEFLAQFPTGRAVILTYPPGSIEIIDLMLVVSAKPTNGTIDPRHEWPSAQDGPNG